MIWGKLEQQVEHRGIFYVTGKDIPSAKFALRLDIVSKEVTMSDTMAPVISHAVFESREREFHGQNISLCHMTLDTGAENFSAYLRSQLIRIFWTLNLDCGSLDFLLFLQSRGLII